jgi:flagellar biosynthesis GTPase FlhF
MKRLFAAHPTILSLVVFAFIIDAVMVASTGRLWEDASFALGSTLVVAYFFGISLFLRFVVFRNRIHAGITWVATILIGWGWFTLQVALDQSTYRPSLLFIMCLLAAFKTMRLEQSEEEKIEAEQRLANDQSETTESETYENKHNNDNHEIKDKKTAANSVTSPPGLAPSSSNPINSPERTNTGENQHNLRSLKQVLAIMAAIGCLVALWDMPDDYYKVLRFIVVAACGVIIWNIQKSSASDARKTWFTVAFGMLAVFFNPIMPIELDDDTWRWVTLTGAVGFTLLEVGKSAAISLAIVATVSLVAIDYAKEQKQIAYNKAFEENIKRIRDEKNKKKLEEQEIREKQWAEWEAERLKKKQIEEERYEKAKIEWQRKEEEKKRVDQENEKRRELESQKYLEAERKRKKFLDKQIRESDARIAAYKKQRDAALAKKEFTIVGQVKNPGTYDYGLLTLNIFKAIEKAGGWTRQANMEEIKVKRTINGKNQTLIVNTRMLTDKPWGSFDIMAGDVIEVSKK